MDSPPSARHDSNAKKRSSPDVSREFYPRKRALVACEVCRRKKSKCDNERPACATCRDLGIDCIYRDKRSDHSTYDLASLEILDKIGHLTKVVETQNLQISGLVSSWLGDKNSPNALPLLGPVSNNEHLDASGSRSNRASCLSDDINLCWSGPLDEATLLAESLTVAEKYKGTCEDLLDWPIFEGKYDRSETEMLIFNPALARDSQQRIPGFSVAADSDRRSGYDRGIREEDVPGLLDRFLVNVHIKNPILDTNDTMRMGKDIAENGFKWDAPSCLVLIASALGCLSSSFTPGHILLHQIVSSNSIEDTDGYSTAESYYVASQKRMGLLETSIITSQCHFLSGVYEMYSLRPLRAWSSFNRACVMLQTYLKMKSKTCTNPSDDRLERRLYWSCLKSESEIRMEICLPPSGLSTINYPDALPTPPRGSSNPLPKGSIGDSENHTTTLSVGLEQSWFYYLSDIAVRRIANRIVNTFYQGSASVWLSIPIDKMIHAASELELQLIQWQDAIPDIMASPSSTSPNVESEELWLVQRRVPELRMLLYRPFLYLAIHQPPSWPHHTAIASYVENCLDGCIKGALQGVQRHRHHGTWYVNRVVFSYALMILAAVKSRCVNVPTTWRTAVHTAMAGLSFWGKEAPDLARGRVILERVLCDIEETDVETTGI